MVCVCVCDVYFVREETRGEVRCEVYAFGRERGGAGVCVRCSMKRGERWDAFIQAFVSTADGMRDGVV